MLTTGDPFFFLALVYVLLLLEPETYSFSRFSRRFFVPCLEAGALRRCPPFQKCIQRQSLTNPKFTALRNPVRHPSECFCPLSLVLSWSNALHYIQRQTSPLLLFARTSYFKLKRAILRKLRLHNFKFNFVARNFVISPKKFPLVPCLTSTLAADFNVKTTIRAKCYESSNPPKSSKIGFKPWKHYCGRAFHQKYQMFSNGNSTNFSTARLRIIDIFSEADILNIKSWKKLNFLLPPLWANARK